MIDANYLVPDLLAPNLRLIFCGTAPSTKSALDKAYYAKPGNKFWPSLYRVGITPQLFAPHDYRLLLPLGMGLTDLCKTYSGTDAELPPDAFKLIEFHDKIKRYRPAMIAFTSKNAARQVLGVQPEYGLQIAAIGKTQLFVLPSPSGLATRFFDLAIWQDLADILAKRLK